MRDDRALSQAEIDALLTRIPGGGGRGPVGAETLPTPALRDFSRSIKAYDFRRPDKFSKEQWATLQSMHEQFARLVSAALSSRLRTLVQVHMVSLEQGLYEEWQSAVSNPTICYVLSMQPLSGNIVVEVGMEVADEVIDRLLGGTGSRLPEAREIGEIEIGLLRAFSRSLTHSLSEIWSQIQPLELQVQDIGLDASLVQVAGPSDVAVSATFEVSVGTHTGRMSICLPFNVLEPVVGKLSAQVWIASGKFSPVTPDERRAMAALIQRSQLELAVRLGGVDVPASVLMDLQEGDTFVLDRRPGRALEVLVGDRIRFTALPGTSGPNLAIQIAETVDDEVSPVIPISTSSVQHPPPQAYEAMQSMQPAEAGDTAVA